MSFQRSLPERREEVRYDMNFKIDRIRDANEAAMRISENISNNRWKEVLRAVEEWPELLFWNRIEANQAGCLFIRIWEEDRWAGRDCVRVLLKKPELLKKLSIPNYGNSTFSFRNAEYWVSGPLTGILAGAGETELLEEVLKAGLNVDGWTEGGWYEGKDGLYHFENQAGCSIYRQDTRRYHNRPQYPSVRQNETTPLLIAILREDVEMVQLLVRYGATFVPDSELCQSYLKELDSWTIRDLLKETYGGGGK